MNNNTKFADRLKELRLEYNKSLAQLAKELEVSSVSLGYYERSERVPDIDVLYKIAKYFDVTADFLIGLTDNRTHENAAIGKITGLSDKSIEVLSELRYETAGEYIETLNFIIEHSGDFDMSKLNMHDLTIEEVANSVEFNNTRNSWEQYHIKIIELISDYFHFQKNENKLFLTRSGKIVSEKYGKEEIIQELQTLNQKIINGEINVNDEISPELSEKLSDFVFQREISQYDLVNTVFFLNLQNELKRAEEIYNRENKANEKQN